MSKGIINNMIVWIRRHNQTNIENRDDNKDR